VRKIIISPSNRKVYKTRFLNFFFRKYYELNSLENFEKFPKYDLYWVSTFISLQKLCTLLFCLSCIFSKRGIFCKVRSNHVAFFMRKTFLCCPLDEKCYVNQNNRLLLSPTINYSETLGWVIFYSLELSLSNDYLLNANANFTFVYIQKYF
jgi:hypothetical protein